MFALKVLVTGTSGQLGYDILQELKKRNIVCVGSNADDLNLTNEDLLYEFIKGHHPDAVIHCAAYTAVDNAQDEPDTCMQVNAQGAKNVAAACDKIGAKMLYISSDYVFPGDGEQPYETFSQTNPLNVYGKSKLEGEKNVIKHCKKHFIIRTSWVFGENGNNFVKTILKLAKERDSICVVDDQIGSPTYTKDLAGLICEIVCSEKYGIYHATNEGFCSFADFAREIVQQCGFDIEVKKVSSEEYSAKAARPKNSRLSKKSLDENGFGRLPHWKDALSRFLENEFLYQILI
ncbi:MAG: dTDP-4-dehydrorhamnose reductase [Oscillospiraceae bacterium]|jgi:dTDP-4-dehydrorhamnose reductase|nr:dTDP-4-dehydrorhamnose reductase [Oscillospiraceae bacterium]